MTSLFAGYSWGTVEPCCRSVYYYREAYLSHGELTTQLHDDHAVGKEALARPNLAQVVEHNRVCLLQNPGQAPQLLPARQATIKILHNDNFHTHSQFRGSGASQQLFYGSLPSWHILTILPPGQRQSQGTRSLFMHAMHLLRASLTSR